MVNKSCLKDVSRLVYKIVYLTTGSYNAHNADRTTPRTSSVYAYGGAATAPVRNDASQL